MTGYEAAQAIRGLNRADSVSVPIIAMTADAFAEDIQLSLIHIEMCIRDSVRRVR